MRKMKKWFRRVLYRHDGCHQVDGFLKQRDFQQEKDRESCMVIKNQSRGPVVPT
jgi:hypothetical protein